MAAAIVAAGSLSCDNRPAPPPITTNAASQPADNATPPRPTTQQLTDGPRQRVPLGAGPLSISVPQSWKLDRIDLKGDGGDVGKSVYLLAGPAPAGDVQISIAQQPDVDGDFINALLKTAKEDAAKDPNATVELREAGVNRVLEERSIVSHDEEPGGPQYVRWSVGYFTPAALDYHWYKVSFVEMPQKQFEADKAFLVPIMKSLRIDSGKGLP